MKFPWIRNRRGVLWPEIPVGFKRNGRILPFNTTVLVDTGADSTVLDLQYAPSFGFKVPDLEKEKYSVVGGAAFLYSAKAHELIEVQIGRSWLVLPTLKFAANQEPNLLGRDAIFPRLEMRMTSDEVEFVRATTQKRHGS
jgi:hypothetical protein